MTDQIEAQKHNEAMQRQKERVDAKIESAQVERGIALLLTGNGKGKSSSGFGMVMRALGYEQKVAVVQFIKGAQDCGEIDFLSRYFPQVDLVQMNTGFTWNTQDKNADIKAAERTWNAAKNFLNNEAYDLVVLDELTYMLGYRYLPRDAVIRCIEQRPVHQSVVVTGRGGGRELRSIMDTVSDVQNVKHAFASGIKARKGVDF